MILQLNLRTNTFKREINPKIIFHSFTVQLDAIKVFYLPTDTQ